MNPALDDFQAQIRARSSNKDPVTVNQRRLVDNILARYSTDYVVFRELIQNSDDAGAKKVEIVFETGLPNGNKNVPNLSAKIKRVTFKNSGMDFRPQDWSRLKTIADGNPDDSKIGAFGVGFYSLFSICEEPFILSGEECMLFYWDNNQLYTNRNPIPKEKQNKGWTTFLLNLRDPMDMPNVDKFGFFIAQALGFTANLRDVTVYMDHHRLLNINKTLLNSRPMAIPDIICKTSPLNIFTLETVELQSVRMDATQLVVSERARWVDRTSQISLRIASGNLSAEVSKELAAEMERTTKKYPPKQTSLRLLYRSYEEPETSTNNMTVLQNLLPFPEQGRIFIGFPTHQTTGFYGHVAGRFIPTVLRENLDLVIGCLRVWNLDLLSMAGSLSRMMYEDEIAQIRNLYNKNLLSYRKLDGTEDKSIAKTREELEGRSLHALKTFQPQTSSPEKPVGEHIENYFFKKPTVGLSVLSSHGVKELSNVRIPDPAMSAFLENLPVLPTSVYSGSQEFMGRLEKAGKVQKISFGDVLGELKSRILTKTQMVALLRWRVDNKAMYIVSDADAESLLQAARVNSGDSALSLSTFKWFASPTLGGTDMPLPPMTLPYDITKTFEASELQEISPVWQELSFDEWIKFIVEKPDFETSPEFAEKVLHVLSDGWDGVPEDSQKEIVAHLMNKKCIPTRHGMKIPKESYFDTVTLFPDLPVMQFTKQPNDELLLAMGARQSVEIQLVFDRLVDAGSWDHIQLVGYLASVSDKLSPNDIKDLQTRPIFPRADQPTASSTQPVSRHLASTLYAPTETHIALGLPIIEWKGDWNERSDEAGILFVLGLEKEPRMKDLLERTAPPYEQAIRDEARQLFVSNFERLYSNDWYKLDMAFLPTTRGSFQTRGGCFWNENCGVMGFPILQEDWRKYATLLGIQENPSPEELLDTLSKSPPSTDKARPVFEYLFSVQAKFQDEHWTRLKTEKFIPLGDTGESIDPQNCYFYRKDLPYRDLLATVDFGSSANRFLKSCGVKEEAKPMDLAQLVARSPEKVLRHERVDGYRSILRQIATHIDAIKSNEPLLAEMKNSSFLLGELRINQDDDTASVNSEAMADAGQAGSGYDEIDESTGQVIHYRLDRAEKIYLVDDTILQQIFTPLCAPMDDLLESLYESLGSTLISSQVNDNFELIGKRGKTTQSEALHELIVERAPLLLGGYQAKLLRFNQDWLKTSLKVRQLPEIRLDREFKPTGAKKSQGTTACMVQSKGVYYLLVTPQKELDYFDVAEALAKTLLKKNSKKKLHDSFMWSNLLSNSLESLKRKGFQVDRILKAKAAKAKAEAAKKTVAAATTTTTSETPETPVIPEKSVRPETPATPETSARPETPATPETPTPERPETPATLSISPTDEGVTPTGDQVSRPQTPTPSSPVTSTDEARSAQDLEMALIKVIENCRPHKEGNLQSEPMVSQVPTEHTNSRCEHIPAQSLKEAGKAGDFKFFLHNDCDEHEVRTNKSRESLERFAKLLMILARDVFRLDPTTIHVMYEKKRGKKEGETIAFNLNGSLFFNWQYYVSLGHDDGEGLADKKVQGRSVKARDAGLIYWFFTIAHELAHSLAPNHDSKHGYIMSSFCEQFLPAFMAVMASSKPTI